MPPIFTYIPSWMPDLVRAGALENLDPLVDKFGYRDELKDIAPAYRDNQMTVNGKIYGFPDDGDVMLLYYRKDIFEDPKMMEEFKAKHGYALAPPKDWKQFDEIGQFITDKMAPKTYGAGFFRTPPYPQYMFQERFRMEGGKFFDADICAGLAHISPQVGQTAHHDHGVRRIGAPPVRRPDSDRAAMP